MVKVSIIVPIYNTEKYLKKCLSSLIYQKLTDIEIICINDGSTDNSLKILESEAAIDRRIKVIDKKNEGQSIARNIGINMAQGEYIGFVDSDDWVDPDYFEKLYNAATKYNCDIACAGFKRVRRFRTSTKKQFSETKVYSDIDEKLKADNIPDHNYIWNKIYRRKSWLETEVKFTPNRSFEDVALLTPIMYKLGNLVTVPDTFYYYRTNPKSTVASTSAKNREDLKWACDELYNFAKEHDISLPRRVYSGKEYIKLFKWTIIKKYRKDNVTKYMLFGFIPFMSKIEI